MSIPSNALANYRTYSYHQFLAVCSSTAAAESLGNVSSGNFSALQHPTVDRAYTPRSTSGGQYILLVDGMSDAHLNISKAKWTTSIVPDAKSSSGAQVGMGVGVEGVIEIYEANSARFISIIGSAATQMGVPFPSLSFMLKTIFVGERFDGTSEYITDVNPFVFNLYDMSAVFDSTGSKYRMQIFGQVGSNMKQDGVVLSGSSVAIESGDTLGVVLGRVAEIANAVVASEAKAVDDVAPKTVSKKPKYVIKVASAIAAKLAGDNAHIRLAGTKDNPVLNLSQGSASSVAQSIEAVLLTSSSMVDEAKTSDTSAVVERRKLFTINQVSSVNAAGESVHTFFVGMRETLTAKQGEDMRGQKADLTLDYLFTGNNTDIINLDMKLTHALNVVMSMGTSNATPTAINAQAGNTVDTVVNPPQQSSGGTVVSPDKFVAGHNFDQVHYGNMNYPASTANFYHLLSKQAEFDTVGAVITVHGNPKLLGEMTINPTQMEGLFEDISKKGINANWLNTPTTLRLNVKFPRNPDHLPDGFDDFWYLGLYRMMVVEHTFKDGKFTQTITVAPITGTSPVFDGVEPSGGTASQRTTNARLTSNSGTGLVRDGRGLLPNTSKANSLSYTAIKDIVLKVAAEEGVDPNLMLALVKQESNFNTSAVGPYVGGYCGQALGVMQVCPRTAEGEGIPREDLMSNPEQNIRAGTRYMNRMLTRYSGDVVLALAAYNAGPETVGLPGTIPNNDETQNYVKKIPRYIEQFANGTAPEDKAAAKLAGTTKEQIPSVTTVEDAGSRTVKYIKEVTSDATGNVG